MVPRVDACRCDGCGICVEECPPKITGLILNTAAILVDLCEECGICAQVCPIHAIQFRLPSVGNQDLHEAYATEREAKLNPGNWRVGVPLGGDGEGHPSF